MFKIGEFAKICFVSIDSLRHYDRIGLLKPARIDPDTGYRYYSASQAPRLNRILVLKGLGFSLEQIGVLLADNLAPEEMQGMLRLREAQIERQIDEESERLNQVRKRLDQILEENQTPKFEVVIKSVLDQPYLSSGWVTETDQRLAEMSIALSSRLRETSLHTNELLHVVVHAAPTNEIYHNVEIGYVVEESAPEKLHIAHEQVFLRRNLPAVEQLATVVYEGPCNKVHRGYTALFNWLAGDRYRSYDRVREVYLHSVLIDEDPKNVVELQIPIKPIETTEVTP